MIVQTRENKDLVIPKSLGNFVTEGSGGGVTPEEAAEIAAAVTAEAIGEYDTELQVEIEDIRDAVSGNSEDIQALSATTEEISQQIGILSGLPAEITALSAQTSANTQNIGILSGDVETNALAIANLENNVVPDLQEGIVAAGGLAESANTKVEALSAVTSGLAVDIETLAESNNTVFFNLLEDYGTSWDEVARLFDDIVDAINTGKTAVLISCFKDDGLRTGCFAYCYKFEGQNRIYAGGAGEYFYNSKNIAARAAVTLYRNDYYNLTAVDGHFRYDPIGAIEGYTLPTASSSTKGGIKVGSGLTMNGEVMSIKAGEGLGFSGDTLVVSGGTGGGKTPIVLEEHYGDPTWTAIYNAVAQSAVTMGVEEFAKNYDIYIKKLDDQENPYSVKQAVGFAIQQGEDWDETAEDWVQTTWITFNTFDGVGNTYWLLSTGSRGLGVIGGFDGNVPHPKSAWINIDASGNVTDYDINYVDEGLAQYSDNGTDYAFSMYLCCLLSDAERYRGNLQNFRKNYNGVNGNFFFRFVIDIDGTEYEAEYYWDQENQQLVKIVFQTYKAYLQSILNS